MAYEWNELGINEITNLYLYGQTTTPSDLTSSSLIRPGTPANAVIPPIEVNIASYMESGPGRFAYGSKSSLVQAFFGVSMFTGVQDSWFEPGQINGVRLH